MKRKIERLRKEIELQEGFFDLKKAFSIKAQLLEIAEAQQKKIETLKSMITYKSSTIHEIRQENAWYKKTLKEKDKELSILRELKKFCKID